MSPPYAELAAVSNFSFLHGASHPEELAVAAAAKGLAGLAVTDRNSLAGVVRAHMAAKETGLGFAPGCRLVFSDATPDILVWPQDRTAYGRLTRLLTVGNRRAPKGECHLGLDDLITWGEGLHMAALPDRRHLEVRADDGGLIPEAAPELGVLLDSLRAAFPGKVRLAAALAYGAHDRLILKRLDAMADAHQVPLLAVGDVLYHAPDRRPLQDVLVCIREHVTLDAAGRRLEANAERYLRDPAAMARLFRGYEHALTETVRLFDALDFSLDSLRYEYPEEPCGDSARPQQELERLTEIGARERYGETIPEKVRAGIAHEMALIAQLDYAPYFLTVFDIVRFARTRGILAQGRGSAANSVVCFCLGITEVDPERADLLFERFISPERNEPPDIDVDFEHERREEVIQYIYRKYGRERAGLAATVITYRSRSAVREVGKVFGLSEDSVAALAGTVWGWSSDGVDEDEARRVGLDPADRRLARVLEMTQALVGFPRHLSQHVGGFVITRGRLDEVVPIQNAAMEDRTVIEWDKDDLESLGMLKIDILALGMLSCIRKALDLMRSHYRQQLTVASIPPEDPAVYDMLCRADSVGVFQVESRAQMSMLPRLRPRTFYDLVIEVAIVRPGPIQGDMVHPYLRRRQGLEPVSFPKKELADVLAKTMGVPLFQEQAMKIAIVAADFTPGEADRLRRAMATFRRVGTIGSFQKKLVDGMVANGYKHDFAERCFRQIEGFGEYGFPESHAASFALLVYASAWLKSYYPDVFLAAILNSQPMGFYAPAQLVRDAREHGVAVRPVDINRSGWDSGLEDGPEAAGRIKPQHAEMRTVIRATHAVRLGMRQIKGLSEEDAERIVAARGRGYDSVRDLWLRTGLARTVIERLADADAFRSLGLDRRAALWAARGLDSGGERDRLPLFDHAELGGIRAEPDADLPPMPLGEHVINDYRFLSLSLKAHPAGFVRDALRQRGIVENIRLRDLKPDRTVKVSGLVLVRQRPGSAKGVIFMTLEDETGIANAIVWPKAFERFRPVVLGARFVEVTGSLQREGEVIHVIARRIEDLTPMLAGISEEAVEIEPFSPTDEVKRPVPDMQEKIRPASRLVRLMGEVPHLRQDYAALSKGPRKVLPKGRNFH